MGYILCGIAALAARLPGRPQSARWYLAALAARLPGRPQSARWYLGGCQGEEPMLTDGTDGNWASAQELDAWWEVPVRDLPKGWRKVWFKDRPGILKPTAPEARRYMENPFVARLGSTPEVRGRMFGRLLMSACWHGRTRAVRDDGESSEPGVVNF